MFGYITINKPELKIKDFDIYHAYYCGLCTLSAGITAASVSPCSPTI